MNRSIFLVAAAAVLLVSGCDGSGGPSPGANGEDMFMLARMNGCLECHIVNASTVGPSWNEISERYREAPYDEARALLIHSVKKGSRGQYLTWKGVDGMPPLEGRVAEEDIERLVDYILQLRR